MSGMESGCGPACAGRGALGAGARPGAAGRLPHRHV